MICIALGVILLARSATAPSPKKPGRWYKFYFDWKAQHHLQVMTSELLKDVEYKMRYADFIFASYGGQVDPQADKIYSEVGYLDSQIQKKFRYMLNLYRQSTITREIMADKLSEFDLINANHLIQGAYHEILILKDLLNNALDKQEALQRKDRAMQFFMEFNRKQKTYTPTARSKASRAPVRRQADGDTRRKGVDVKKAESKSRKIKWTEGRGMNESAQWK